jgi:hypothetical protein
MAFHGGEVKITAPIIVHKAGEYLSAEKNQN